MITSFNEFYRPPNVRTKAETAEVAKKYRTREKFKNATGEDKGAYNYAYTHGWLDDITIHMKPPRPGHKQLFYEVAAKYKYHEDLKKAEPTIYDIMFKMGWIQKIYGKAYRNSIKNKKSK